ncbi:MAG: hypothetical protein RLZZ283_117 [Candidatus Parcubacteria bacterium]
MSDYKPPTDEELKAKLTPEEYHVLREGGTEPRYTGEQNPATDGVYKCKVCGNQLFEADTKFESAIRGLEGWPSFDNALPGAVTMKPDFKLGVPRTEILCARCGSHLGHVFDGDSDSKTGKHYCVNSVCLS